MINCKFENENRASLRHAVVDILVLKEGKILLVKRSPRLIEGGKWALVGGFMERDETIAQAARRETMEETGYEVKNLTLLGVSDNPNRKGEDRQNIVFIHFCEAGEQVGAPDDESVEQRWFPLTELPSEDLMAFDHTDTIRFYLDYVQNPFPLPKVK